MNAGVELLSREGDRVLGPEATFVFLRRPTGYLVGLVEALQDEQSPGVVVSRAQSDRVVGAEVLHTFGRQGEQRGVVVSGELRGGESMVSKLARERKVKGW